MLMKIDTLKWDKNLCKVFDIPMHILPEIRSSAEIYGYITNVTKLAGVPVSGVSYFNFAVFYVVMIIDPLN